MQATELHALPQSCYLSSVVMILIRGEMFPKLKAAMADDEIIAAHNEQQPALDKMRAITCRGCNEIRCPLNFRYRHRTVDPDRSYEEPKARHFDDQTDYPPGNH